MKRSSRCGDGPCRNFQSAQPDGDVGGAATGVGPEVPAVRRPGHVDQSLTEDDDPSHISALGARQPAL
jgi:hypothetical protein